MALSDMHVIAYCNEGPDAGLVYYQGSTRIWSGESYYFAREGE